MQSSGYMSPEYAMGGLFSVKSDVYSFGVLILEIVSGSRNSSFHLTMDSPSLLAYVSKSSFMSLQGDPMFLFEGNGDFMFIDVQ